ncbi:MAG: DUF58 domain-containing protein [Microscillaceae bacterium]|jgi:uncharacterized protein (DUF58 family)|nr:DUF58 domain-containing protein [Microscillaceae bacterium]
MEKEDFKAILTKVRNYEIRIRKAVNSQMRGSFDSVFKGTGLEFDDVRAYQYGDDVRRIDWHVSAKGDETYIKVFKEEKEQTVFFLLDVSDSQKIGADAQTKLDLTKEICSVLALSAVKEESEVGLICFSDQKEKYIKPDKGMKKAYEIMLNLFRLEPISRKTDLAGFIHFALNLIKRRAIVILISDFIAENYQDALKSLARKHDLIVLHIFDQKDLALPKLGLIPIIDKETQTTRWVNTSAQSFQKQLQESFEQSKAELENFCRQYQVNYLPIQTNEDFVPSLIKLFKVRNLSNRGAS